ncbi:MAG: bifunctional [glutamate--ammonia ligase]-adenylyl-L-tyrosine phosphorylase/[glutamate--ammonia-ligase] adenylyltransferase [Gammaproteobacteria bacterium]|nr:bifunctional [glutamate--ammonia ligase]-adenylyl-L-tyrosine phosphorylase/[glutamate--ammonia-ligase] adenylyltransferase [Gammaproteobacteria bacterium]
MLQTAIDADTDIGDAFTRALAASEFLLDVGCRQPAWLAQWFAQAAFRIAPPTDLIGAELDGVVDEADLKRRLRVLRNRVMAHDDMRHVTRLADYEETIASVTRLAEQCIDRALDRLYEWACARSGTPIGAVSGLPQRLVVLAMGKLGARELNLSSDVDLVFAYPEAGETEGGRRTNQQFFVRLAQRLIQAIDDATEDGFVFRVDMRLRPYGDSGAMALHFDAMSQYFEQQGRDWERYAWIRARPCAGDVPRGDELIAELKPFVFRRYLDFGAIQALRDMKSRIDAERSRERMADDVKLGPGGIREVEFVAQLLQLIWAGRNPRLKLTRVGATLAALRDAGLMDAGQVEELTQAYVFLRNTEHGIQALRDEQTQRLPETQNDRLRLALMMGFSSIDAFLARLAEHRGRVAKAFESVIGDEPAASAAADNPFDEVWLLEDAGELSTVLAERGFGEEPIVLAQVSRLRTLRDRPWVSGEGRKRFETLMPRLLAAMAASGRAALSLERIVPLLEAVMRRSAYFVLLLENPAALKLLVSMCAESRWIASELARHPMLLDELLDPDLLYTVPDKPRLQADLRRRLEGVSDLEQQIEILRAFKETHEFRVAACELRDILPLMNVSDYHTFLAEVILAAALDIAWQHTAQGDAYLEANRPFAIIGFGKLGGLELAPGSDLDIVFIHDLADEHGRFLSRMVRRLIHVLTAHTHSGALYDVDTRLRPSGRRGTMVSSLAAFAQYQEGDAAESQYKNRNNRDARGSLSFCSRSASGSPI